MTQRLDNGTTAGNSTFAIGGLLCSADSLVVAESSVLRNNICAKKPAHRKSAKRYSQWFIDDYSIYEKLDNCV